jgi:hypothetical protein
MNNTEPELVSLKTLSSLLDTPEKTIRDWVYKARKRPSHGSIPYYKIGTSVKFSPKEIRHWYGQFKITAGV